MRERIAELGGKLRAAAGAWSRGAGFDERATAELRQTAIRLCHRHYRETIPAYARLCDDMGVGADADLDVIVERCTVTDDLFKSYQPAWLESGDFAAMTDWLADVCGAPELAAARALGAVGPAGAAGLEDWLSRLAQAGIEVLYSSGTSGILSFVPRDPPSWQAYRFNGPSYLMQRAVALGLDLSAMEGVVLGFRGGRMGIQRAGVEISRYIAPVTHLYERELVADSLWRAIRSVDRAGPPGSAAGAEAGQGLGGPDWQRVVDRLTDAARAGRPVWLFGAPFQVAELCDRLAQAGSPPLAPGSVVNLGGGWKRFEGRRLQRDELLARIQGGLGVPPERVLEAYAMVELNAPLMRCGEGRYHVPPLVEPLLYDESLSPRPFDDEATGVLGFLDPTATSYVGFVVTGDQVSLTRRPCPCGLAGPSITGQVQRAAGREVRGCGGIMASVRV